MKFEAFVARRYLHAKRKQAFIGVISLITLVGITLGVGALNVALSIHNGMRDAFMTSLIGETGTLHFFSRQAFFSDLDEKEKRLAREGFSPADLEIITSKLSGTSGARAWTLMREDPGVVVASSRGIRFARFKSIDPASFSNASDRLTNLEAGTLSALTDRPPDSLPGIILGYDMARNLGVSIGTPLQIAVGKLKSAGFSRRQSQGLQLREMKVEVVGIFKTGNSQFDEYEAYLNLQDGMRLMGTKRVSSVMVTFTSVDHMDRAKQALKYDPDMPLTATIIDFRDLNKGLLEALNLEKAATTFVISLFILIVALNMVSALIMMVMEKHRDIGIMKSFGTPRRVIQAIFIRQGMTLAVKGTLLGTVLGVGGALLTDHFRLIKLDNKVYEVLSYLPFQVNPTEVALVALGSLVLAWLTALYPARQAARMDPVEALKYD